MLLGMIGLLGAFICVCDPVALNGLALLDISFRRLALSLAPIKNKAHIAAYTCCGVQQLSAPNSSTLVESLGVGRF